MKPERDSYLPAALSAVTGIGVILISLLVEHRLLISEGMSLTVGIVFVYTGMALVIWSAFYIRDGILSGLVSPRSRELVKDGPYRFVRHPVYLGTTIALSGVALSLRSWPGLLALLILHLPCEIHKARLEEKALAQKFGDEWTNYAGETAFFLPFLVK